MRLFFLKKKKKNDNNIKNYPTNNIDKISSFETTWAEIERPIERGETRVVLQVIIFPSVPRFVLPATFQRNCNVILPSCIRGHPILNQFRHVIAQKPRMVWLRKEKAMEIISASVRLWTCSHTRVCSARG